MKYLLAIHKEDESDFGVTVPDIPGCFSGGSSLEEAVSNAHEAIEAHLELLAEDGEVPPKPQNMEAHVANDEYAGAIWIYAEVDITAYLGKTEKVNATIPTLLRIKIDNLVDKGQIKSRSAFLAESAALNLQAYGA